MPLAGFSFGPAAAAFLDKMPPGKLRAQIVRKARSLLTNPYPPGTLVDREGDVVGVVVPDTRKETLEAVAKPIVDKSATIMTDGNPSYADLDDYFHGHHAVDHNKQFVRAVIIHTNFAESYHSLLKRGLIGAFHHVSAEHLHRYVNEFSFRWNSRKETDGERTERAVRATAGKRLTYRPLVGKEQKPTI
jgi:hypothetical protein